MGVLLDTECGGLVTCSVVNTLMPLFSPRSSSFVVDAGARRGRVFFGWWYYAQSEGATAVA
jgi:hypothetical protein